MANAVWPASLPQYVETPGYKGKKPDSWNETQMEAGPPHRQRKSRGGRKEEIDCVIWLTDAQKTTFDTFYDTTLQDGILPFDWVHPIGRAAATFEFASPPSHGLISGAWLSYKFKLRVLP